MSIYEMESIVKLHNIPIIEKGLVNTKSIYERIKRSQFCWGLQHMESVFGAAVETMQPAVLIFEGPIHAVDQLLCRSIDFIEQKVPSIYLPPEMMYSSTKQYMSDQLVRPVLKRANSVKQIGNVASSYAADRIDDAIDVANQYVERYLPQDDQVDISAFEGCHNENESSRSAHTLQKSKVFSRKLKRRLTQRTLTEARAIQKQSKEAIHVLIYAGELIVNDPKLAIQKAIELWSYLSKDEPENQARPNTLEQLIVLVTRETVRKVVHLINFSVTLALRIPRSILMSVKDAGQQYIHFFLAAFKLITTDVSAIILHKMHYFAMDNNTSDLLEQLGIWLAGREEEKQNDISVNKLPNRRHRRDLLNHQTPTSQHSYQ